jgi:hypothetical protein
MGNTGQKVWACVPEHLELKGQRPQLPSSSLHPQCSCTLPLQCPETVSTTASLYRSPLSRGGPWTLPSSHQLPTCGKDVSLYLIPKVATEMKKVPHVFRGLRSSLFIISSQPCKTFSHTLAPSWKLCSKGSLGEVRQLVQGLSGFELRQTHD